MKISRSGAKRSIQGVLALSLALCSNAALALGLGDIRVLSKPGQPLVAEIPVISSDPGELENARVGLASAATFQRVGLSLPEGMVKDLRFAVAQDAHGRAVIRVTSPQNVDAPVINFLIEVDWGNGRLVREYSALIDAPVHAAAVSDPVIEAPQAVEQNLIVREPDAPAVAEQPSAAPSPAAVSTPAPQPAAPVAVPGPPPPTATVSGGQVTVRKGQTLSQIAGELAREQGLSLNQTMVALLHANPEAFIKGNVHLLKQGAVLRTPRADEMAGIDAAEATAVIRAQTAQWRQARSPIPQPAGETVGAAATTAAAPATTGGAPQARLEIAPALATDGNNAGTMSGMDAQGEGDMLARQQLQQAQEELASRDAELTELRSRVAELEKLQQQQQSLIEMKDSDLAAAQKRLAEAPRAEADNGPLWLGLGGGLAIVIGLAWWLSRRRKPSPLPPLAAASGTGPVWPGVVPAPADETLAEHDPSVAPGHDAEPQQVHEHQPQQLEDTVVAAADVVDEAPAPVFELHSDPVPATREEPLSVPAGEMLWYTPQVPAEPKPQPEREPEHVSSADELAKALEALEQRVVGETASVETDQPASGAGANRPWQMEELPPMRPLHPEPAARERLELAIAYMDLGDAATARTLLREVAAGDDMQARNEALELLERLQ